MGYRIAAAWSIVVGVLIVATTHATFAKRSESQCDAVLDAAVPEGTKFDHQVDFELGAKNTATGDDILIREVRGTSSQFEVGQFYLVRGDYVLGSAEEAALHLTVTATRRGDGCTRGNDRGHIKVHRGAGTFELAVPILYPGHPHIWIDASGRSEGGSELPGVYFGKGAFLRR